MLDLPFSPLNQFLLVHATQRSLLLIHLLVDIKLGHGLIAVGYRFLRYFFLSVGMLMSPATQKFEL